MTVVDPAQAKAACTDLVLGFAYFVDQRRYEELVALFVDDGIFVRPGLEAKGHAAIRAFLAARPETVETRHVCAPPFFVEIGDDHATTITYVTMFHGPSPVDAGPITIVGTAGVVEFHHVFVRTASGWRIACHESRVAMIQTQ